MSIASTVAALDRANAAYKAARSNPTPVAKRGMFTMVEREHRYSYQLHALLGVERHMRRHCQSGAPSRARLAAEASRLANGNGRQRRSDCGP